MIVNSPMWNKRQKSDEYGFADQHRTKPSLAKGGKRKSIVWEHFTIENVSAGCRRASCKQCKQRFSHMSTGSKDKSHLTQSTPASKGHFGDSGLAAAPADSKRGHGTIS
ncbi:Zinc finger BED domain-containing protein RICESLEEPER 2, partial [Cucurbita argyrosperma subsp. sororia]